MLRLILVAAIAILTLVLPGSTPLLRAETSIRATQAKECTVYVTRTGDRYHKSSCGYLRKSKIELLRTDAIQRGYTPCKRCGGSPCEG